MSTRKVIILGSGTCVPSLVRSSCSVLIEGEDEKILLDLGPGTMHRLLARNIRIDDIDTILLSHFHPDHASELPAFLFSTKYPAPIERIKLLQLLGGVGIFNFHAKLNDAFHNSLTLSEKLFKMKELEDQGKSDILLKEFVLEWISVNHRPESRAYRFTAKDGFSVVYSGDTDYSGNLIRLAKGADILIIESSFPDGKKVQGHLTPTLAGEIASHAVVSHLVLSHFYPICENYDIEAQCRRAYNGRLTIATDLQEIELK